MMTLKAIAALVVFVAFVIGLALADLMSVRVRRCRIEPRDDDL